MVPKSLSGHPVIRYSISPALRTIKVPGRPVQVKVRRDYAPLFARLLVLLDAKVEPIQQRNTWGYNYRPARLGNGWSDHAAGAAIDVWSDGIGAVNSKKITKAEEVAIRGILERFKTRDGRRVFGWGGSAEDGYVRTKDYMHFFIRPGISLADVAEVTKSLGLRKDGTVA